MSDPVRIAGTVVGSLPTASHFAGGTLAQLATDEEIYIVKGGVWTKLLTTTSGGTVTLAGDVTGVSSANTVVGLTGTGSPGVVAVHASQLLFDSTASSPSIAMAAKAGVGSTMLWLGQNSTNNVGGASVFASGQGGSGNLDGNVLFKTGPTTVITLVASTPAPIVHVNVGDVRWDKAATPVLFQEQRDNDVGVPQRMRFRSQDPYSGATNHGGGNDARIAGNIEWEIGTSVNGADQLGHYVWSIAETPVMRTWTDRLELNNISIRFIYTGSAPLIEVNDAAAGAGAPTTIIAQRGFDARGGDIVVKGGPGGGLTDGGGFIAEVGNVGQPQIQAQQLGSKFVVAFGYPATLGTGDVQASNSNYLLLGDAYNLDATLDNISGPVGGILLASHAGKLLFQNSDGTWVRIDGFRPGAAPGASLGVLDVTISEVVGCIELRAR